MGGDVLSLVIGASVTDYDLGRVLVWHHYGWLWQSTSETVWVVWL